MFEFPIYAWAAFGIGIIFAFANFRAAEPLRAASPHSIYYMGTDYGAMYIRGDKL